jgi:hypothetical protein
MKVGELVQIGHGDARELRQDPARFRPFERERRLRLRTALESHVLRDDVSIEGLAEGLARSRSTWRRKTPLLKTRRSETSFPLLVRKAAGTPAPGARERTSFVSMFWRNDSRSFPRAATVARWERSRARAPSVAAR